jgi:hypothetical protein
MQFLFNYIRRKKPELWGNLSSPIFPSLRCEKSGLELYLAQDAGPLGNLAARQAEGYAS